MASAAVAPRSGRRHTTLVSIVAAAQEAGALPPGDPVRLASAGHLAADGKGHASPEQLVDDLLGYLDAAARA